VNVRCTPKATADPYVPKATYRAAAKKLGLPDLSSIIMH
jgi:hypothetical protein